MALPDPLPVDQFADLFRVQDVEFVLNFHQQSSMTGGGETRYADRAPAMIRAKIRTEVLTNAEAEGIMALINSRGGGLKKVLLHNYRLPYPAADPKGEIIGSTVPRLATITDRLHCSFAGFPAGYEIPLGTWFGLLFDGRRYVGQFAEARTANGYGMVATVEITPPLPAGVNAGLGVVIAKPPASFRIIPNSAFPSQQGGKSATIEFSAEQTYSAGDEETITPTPAAAPSYHLLGF
jgi:hypothetical protein